jgi:Fur family peroxide stress response transcriptional regulator
MIVTRESRYTKEIVELMNEFGHATNAEIAEHLRNTYPKLSLTTVHRATARLQERGILALAPSASDGSMRYDANTSSHDHFMCSGCGGVRDINVAEALIPTISKALDGCKVTGRLVIYGSCEHCLSGGSNK